MQYSNSSKSTPAYKYFSSDLIIVVPTEADARDIEEDLAPFLKKQKFMFSRTGEQFLTDLQPEAQ